MLGIFMRSNQVKKFNRMNLEKIFANNDMAIPAVTPDINLRGLLLSLIPLY